MKLELITVKTADDVELDGALYLPDGSSANWRMPMLAVHGLTWNFYRGPMRWLPKYFIDAEFPRLSLNMRDHDLDKPKDFELSHHDLRAGIDFLTSKLGKAPVIVGHGYANNKIACYAAQSGDDRIETYVLATLGSVKKYRPDIWDAVLGGAQRMRGRARGGAPSDELSRTACRGPGSRCQGLSHRRLLPRGRQSLLSWQRSGTRQGHRCLARKGT
jgi:hypothetical protein